MASWTTGGGEHPRHEQYVLDNYYHDRGERRVVHYDGPRFDDRGTMVPSEVPAPAFHAGHASVWRRASPDQEHVYYVIREHRDHDSRSLSAPPTERSSRYWSPGSDLTAQSEMPMGGVFRHTPGVGTDLGVSMRDDSQSTFHSGDEFRHTSTHAYRRATKYYNSPSRSQSDSVRQSDLPMRDEFGNTIDSANLLTKQFDSPSPLSSSDHVFLRVGSSCDLHSGTTTPLDTRDQSISWTAYDAPPSDIGEADKVRENLARFRRRFPNSMQERILQTLISPQSADSDFKLDKAALDNIFFAVSEIFFDRKLSERVQWEWSHEASGSKYDSRVVGHTRFRESHKGGHETLITLSTPILTDNKYSRRLLISAFLHELIHCYLFIRRGLAARHRNGHTDGFQAIAGIIDDWAGRGKLHLCDMEADLDNFRDRRGHHLPSSRNDQEYEYDFCCPPVTNAWEQQHAAARSGHEPNVMSTNWSGGAFNVVPR